MAQVDLPSRQLALEIQSFGQPDAPPVLLAMGLGMQLLAWPQPYVEGLVAAGFRVILFDNRDAGLSGSGILAPHTAVPMALLASLWGRRFRPAYTLQDMADDTLALADALELDQFDLVGVSMGGMIGQALATRAPTRLRRLVSIMSSAGPATTPRPRASVLWRILRRPPAGASANQLVAHFTRLFTVLGHLTDPAEIARLRERLDRTVRRAYKPEGTSRQLLAVLASPDRTSEIQQIRQPVLVIHGRRDPLVPPPAAKHLARHIPGAQLAWLDIGHYLPLACVPELIRLTVRHLSPA